MNDRVPPDEPLPTRTEAEGATMDLPEGLGFFSTGQVLGGRYEILEMLGRGGMGEVWRAFDLKLRVEVALKALREDLFQTEGRREMLRQEVRAAREVMSPNVCRIFDLHEFDGRELVSMEYVDGATLLGELQERGPLELKEAQDIASQFLSGLEAIHAAGLVHRDVKPENIMLTRAGRVVVMDFGLARGPESGAGSVSGTPAYMAPEHAAGQEVDARADVYSAGVVLAEMVSPEGIKSYQSRQSLWEGMRSEPAQVPDSPWAPVIQRAVARDRERRQNSAHTLIRELEDVTLRVEGAEDLHPYPGLAAFTEEDAEYYFGREAEIERMWRKLDRPRLLAVAGPSGAGKTSFLQAGLAPSARSGWGVLRCTPGSSPFTSLGQALAREMAGDVESVELLARGHDPAALTAVVGRWRQRHDHALLIVDQFEELFTLNASDEQQRFARLLGDLAVEADVFTLLSMRDDFLIRCREHEALAPIFTDLTVLLAPVGGELRRALVQPSTKCGYRFEDDNLVEEMLAEVEGERGALPLLAFAAARLWDKRDRENGLLTRQAYHDIGGVGGALARHAEATVDRIGVEWIPVVRELFRNLVTAEGTRAVREWDELLSVFEDTKREGINPSPTKRGGDANVGVGRNVPQQTIVGAGLIPARVAASDVLRELIDARLLTSYETREDEEEPTRMVEIVHESLLANWPRLVRWQTQDQEGAQLRDELRQSARTWDEHGRHDDRLWTGTAFREYQLWRERYPGGLSEVEEEFGKATTSLAGRRRRRRRVFAAVGVLILIVVLAVVTGLWRRSLLNERRAEAQKMIALGQIRLEDYPTAALSHATASLELADSEEARLLALEALWAGPPAFLVNDRPASSAGIAFSPGGTWLVQPHEETDGLTIVSRDGEQRTVDHEGTIEAVKFGGPENVFLTRSGESISLCSAPEARVLSTARPTGEFDRSFRVNTAVIGDNGNANAVVALRSGNRVHVEALWEDGRFEPLTTIDLTGPEDRPGGTCVPSRSSLDWVGVVEGNTVSVVKIGEDGSATRQRLGRHEGDVFPWCDPDLDGRFFITVNRTGRVMMWDPSGMRGPATSDDMNGLLFSKISHDGSHFFAIDWTSGETASDVLVWSLGDSALELRRRWTDLKNVGVTDFNPIGGWMTTDGPPYRLWSLNWPPGVEPIKLKLGPAWGWIRPVLGPNGGWVANGSWEGISFWGLERPYPLVLRPEVFFMVGGIDFAPDGRFLATSVDNRVLVIPLDGGIPTENRGGFDFEEAPNLWDVRVSPDGRLFSVAVGRRVWIGNGADGLWQIPGRWWGNAEFSPDGRLVAVAENDKMSISVWDLDTKREVSVLRVPAEIGAFGVSFAPDGRLLAITSEGVLSIDIDTGLFDTLIADPTQIAVLSDDGRRMLVVERGDSGTAWDPVGSPVVYDLDTGSSVRLESHGVQLWDADLSPDGTVVATSDSDGLIRVGLATGGEPHLLMGHDAMASPLTIDPLGRWIASGSHDNTIRLWPMPDFSKPPLHTLPREELIAKLKTLTNIRVVRDPDSSTGWTLSRDPFPGWETVPTW